MGSLLSSTSRYQTEDWEGNRGPEYVVGFYDTATPSTSLVSETGPSQASLTHGVVAGHKNCSVVYWGNTRPHFWVIRDNKINMWCTFLAILLEEVNGGKEAILFNIGRYETSVSPDLNYQHVQAKIFGSYRSSRHYLRPFQGYMRNRNNIRIKSFDLWGASDVEPRNYCFLRIHRHREKLQGSF